MSSVPLRISSLCPPIFPLPLNEMPALSLTPIGIERLWMWDGFSRALARHQEELVTGVRRGGKGHSKSRVRWPNLSADSDSRLVATGERSLRAESLS
jgi:hypothetical protein